MTLKLSIRAKEILQKLLLVELLSDGPDVEP